MDRKSATYEVENIAKFGSHQQVGFLLRWIECLRLLNGADILAPPSIKLLLRLQRGSKVLDEVIDLFLFDFNVKPHPR